MFTVFGATGNTGAAVAERLIAAGKSVRVAVRDAAKVRVRGVEIVTGDLDDAAFVTRALTGAEGAYLMTPPDLRSTDLIGRGARIAATYAAAVRATGVPHVVVLSGLGADHATGLGPGTVNHQLEAALADAPATFVRAPMFMDNLRDNVRAMREGMLPVFGGGEQFPVPMIATRDIGEIAAGELLAAKPTPEAIELRGPREYSYADAAAIAREVLGRPVEIKVVPFDAMIPMLTAVGFSPEVAALFREMLENARRGIFAYTGKRVAVGRTELRDVLVPALTA
jgi:uncharacterized protein YbjT (DUF2867 family)